MGSLPGGRLYLGMAFSETGCTLECAARIDAVQHLAYHIAVMGPAVLGLNPRTSHVQTMCPESTCTRAVSCAGAHASCMQEGVVASRHTCVSFLEACGTVIVSDQCSSGS